MLGFVGENGPYVNEDGTQGFVPNAWSWNKRANVLYLEMPGGVGYSYVDNPELLHTDDLQTSEDNLRAFLQWFQKFPEFKNNDLFISGESYAGVYVPYMAWQMDKYNNATQPGDFKFNLKGILIGNGVTNWKFDGDQSYIMGGFPRNLSPIDMQKEIE
jgi:carboxypeptidase C (cathepsin A)